ncbi:MAG: fbpA 2 [Noviherbaspirillum sp.]|nr:fbpA 2 [Noviherbaspirillum sp.]
MERGYGMLLRVGCLLLASLASAGAAHAVEALPQVVAAVAAAAPYSGSEREQFLLNEARKEGRLVVYSSSGQADIAAVIAAFEKKYGLQVTLWRGNSETLVHKVMTEARARRFELDLVDTDGVYLEALSRAQLLQKVHQQNAPSADGPSQPAHGEWISTRYNVFALGYNTNAVDKAYLPKTWEDLLDPRWKGKIAVDDGDFDWFATVLKEMGHERGLALFRELVSKNGLAIRRGHSLLATLVASGEVAMTPTVYSFQIEARKRQGAPVDWVLLKPVVVRSQGDAIMRRAPNPYAALLFYAFMTGEGATVLAKKRHDDELAMDPKDYKLVEPAVVLDELEKWQDLYQKEVVKKNAR